MQEKPCPECNHRGIPDGADFCPNCGFHIGQNLSKHYNDFHENKSIQYSYSYMDNFSVKGKTWNDLNNEKYIYKHEEGYLKVFGLSKGIVSSQHHEIDRLKSCKYFEVGIDLKHVKGPDTQDFGIFFASEKIYQSNVFAITGNSNFYIGKLIKEKWTGKYTLDNAKVKKCGNWNNLKVIFDGKSFLYFVNKWMVYKQDAEFFGNHIGIYFDIGINELWFDDLTVDVVY